MRPVKILVVDDSAFMRLTLSRRLGGMPGFEVVGVAADGAEAVRQVQTLRPDVVTMDVEMPEMDGLTALAHIMATRPTPVIMVSSLTKEGTETAVRALTLGAVDCVGKPDQILGTQAMIQELADRIRDAAHARMPLSSATHTRQATTTNGKLPPMALAGEDRILIIGSSTGGPGALRTLLSALPADVEAGGAIVQHMPAGFTRSLAGRLDEVSAWTIHEAAPGDFLMRGQLLVAPGGTHMVFGSRGEVQLTQDPPVNNVRPAVDVTMRSLARTYGARVLGVVLTGMGHDGTDGALAVREAGGQIVAEAESSCVVYGMPRSVVEAGAANHTAPLPEMAALVARLLRGKRSG